VILGAPTAGPKDLHADVAYGMLAGQDMLRRSTQAKQTDVSGMDSGPQRGILAQDGSSDLSRRNAGREGVKERDEPSLCTRAEGACRQGPGCGASGGAICGIEGSEG
jgi:hypothetical protein